MLLLTLKSLANKIVKYFLFNFRTYGSSFYEIFTDLAKSQKGHMKICLFAGS